MLREVEEVLVFFSVSCCLVLLYERSVGETLREGTGEGDGSCVMSTLENEEDDRTLPSSPLLSSVM